MKPWLIIFLALALAGWSYPTVRQHRLIQVTRQTLARGDAKGTALVLDRLLASRWKSPEALTLIADVAEQNHSPSTLAWRLKAVASDPRPLQPRLDLARSALQAGQIALARQTLLDCSPAEKITAPFHETAGLLSLALHDPAGADFHLAKAATLDPTNRVYRMNLHVAALRSPDPARAQQAEATLTALGSTYPERRTEAWRSLITHALETDRLERARDFSASLLAGREATMPDRVTHLTILQKLGLTTELEDALADSRTRAQRDPASVFTLGAWLTAHGRASHCVDWVHTFPSTLQAESGVSMALADAQLSLGNWTDLRNTVQAGPWPGAEMIRHALLARAQRALGQPDASAASWTAAVQSTDHQREALLALEEMSRRWAWPKETEDLLAELVQRYPEDAQARGRLYRIYFSRGDTAGMFRLLDELHARGEADPAQQNDLACLSILLSKKLVRAHQLALRQFQAHPGNAVFASTYAYSLHRQGQSAQAIRVMETIREAELVKPPLATYYGIILAEGGRAGDREKAAEYLRKGESSRLLPEEKIRQIGALRAIGQ